MVHGVGDPDPGHLLRNVSIGMHEGGASGIRSDLVIDGILYPRLIVDDGVTSIIEANWSDIAKPRRSALSVLDYLVRIIAALLRFAHKPQPARFPLSGPSAIYRFCFEAFLVFSIYGPLVGLAWKTSEQLGARVIGAIGIGFVTTLCCLTVYLKKFGGVLWAGWIWASLIGLATLGVVTKYISINDTLLFATSVYVGSQGVTGLALFFALAHTCINKSFTWDQRVARMGLLILPFFVISAIGALLWATAIFSSRILSDNQYQVWQIIYTDSLETLNYPLAFVELTFATLVAFLAVGFLLVGSIYWFVSRKSAQEPRPRSPGQLARRLALWIIAGCAAVYATLVVVYSFVAYSSDCRLPWQGLSVWEVYSWSSMRFLPYLFFFIGPLSIATAVIVDILFYIVPKSEDSESVVDLSAGRMVRHRLLQVIRHQAERGEQIVVVAHSQGSVIAIDALGRDNNASVTALITAGSPAYSLYDRCLGSTAESRAIDDGYAFESPPNWANVWREGDYIGDVQGRSGVREIDLGPGGHINYWSDGGFWEKVWAFLE
ncbi:MAG: hypothetical protein RLW61_10695 [Gammaproteobacteria bacterium]